MAAIRSSTLKKESRRMLLLLTRQSSVQSGSANWNWWNIVHLESGIRLSQALTSGVPWVP